MRYVFILDMKTYVMIITLLLCLFVGAMRSASDLSPDGPANIYNSVLQVCSPQAKGWGAQLQ